MRCASSWPMPAIGSSSSIRRGEAGERHRELELALLAVRELGGGRGGALREADLGEQRCGLLVEVAIARGVAEQLEAVAAARAERDLDVLGGAEAREQARDLEAASEAEADPGCAPAGG